LPSPKQSTKLIWWKIFFSHHEKPREFENNRNLLLSRINKRQMKTRKAFSACVSCLLLERWDRSLITFTKGGSGVGCSVYPRVYTTPGVTKGYTLGYNHNNPILTSGVVYTLGYIEQPTPRVVWQFKWNNSLFMNILCQREQKRLFSGYIINEQTSMRCWIKLDEEKDSNKFN